MDYCTSTYVTYILLSTRSRWNRNVAQQNILNKRRSLLKEEAVKSSGESLFILDYETVVVDESFGWLKKSGEACGEEHSIKLHSFHFASFIRPSTA